RFPWARVLPYIAAQTAGAFVAAAVVFLTYHDALNHFDGGVRQVSGAPGTGGLFAAYPQAWLSTLGGLIDQIVGTALLVGVIFAIVDEKNMAAPKGIGTIVGGALRLLNCA